MTGKTRISCSIVAMLFTLAGGLPLSYATVQGRAGTLSGRVMDETGAVIPGAMVRVSGQGGFRRDATADENGSYHVTGLAPGKYTVSADAPGFTGSGEISAEILPGRDLTKDFSLKIAPVLEEVTVEADRAGEVSVEPDNNVGAIILRGADLEMLSDDPDDLAAELQALAGPAAGPQGGQIYVDGFSGASIPPKDSIREIRINSDPFSAQYDRLGFGRIQIFTRPGTGTFRGRVSFGFSDKSLNSRNPFATNQPAYQSRLFNGSLSGPAGKKASFTISFQRREIDDNAVINATILDSNLVAVPFSQAIVTPQRRTTLSPRIDYQLSEKVTFVGRYRYSSNDRENIGTGGFSLPAIGYDNVSEGHTVQVTATATLSARTINETRLQFRNNEANQNGDNSIPTVNVLQAFQDGGAAVGMSGSRSNNWEVNNNTTSAHGKHTIKFGGRLRTANITDIALNNFGGTFTFGGGLAPALDENNQIILDGSGNTVLVPITSLERYRRTLVFLAQGLTGDEIRALGGGATQFTLSGGAPQTGVDQADLGVYLLDDWRVRSNLSLSLGLRYEIQDNISDAANFAPRIGFAWAPGGSSGQRSSTVIRGGFGMFYDRISQNLTLQTLRFDGNTQQRYIIQNPDFYPTVPSTDTLSSQLAPQTIRELDPAIRSPYLMQSAIGIERSLPRDTVVATTYTYTRGLHLLRSRNLNAPDPVTGILPFGSDSVFQNESTGLFRQNQLITNIRTRFHRNVSLFGFYSLNKASSDTDGAGTFPANPFDLDGEFSRSSSDIRHRVTLGGSVAAPFGFSFNPFFIWTSGSPFNITTGRDNNGDLVFTDRPSFATDLTDPEVVQTRFGTFDLTPDPGATIIPRNFGRGPSRIVFNLRIGKVFGFGERAGSNAEQRGPGRGRGGITPGGGPGGRGGRRGGGGGRGGFGGGRGGGGRGGRSSNRYSLSVTASVQNILNTTNLGRPIGNLSSPLFGRSNSLAGFGRGRTASGNRTVSLQMRFSF